MSSKIARVLEVLLAKGDVGLNRWEAARLARYTIPASECDRARAVLESITAKTKPAVGAADLSSGRDANAHVQKGS